MKCLFYWYYFNATVVKKEKLQGFLTLQTKVIICNFFVISDVNYTATNNLFFLYIYFTHFDLLLYYKVFYKRRNSRSTHIRSYSRPVFWPWPLITESKSSVSNVVLLWYIWISSVCCANKCGHKWAISFENVTESVFWSVSHYIFIFSSVVVYAIYYRCYIPYQFVVCQIEAS